MMRLAAFLSGKKDYVFVRTCDHCLRKGWWVYQQGGVSVNGLDVWTTHWVVCSGCKRGFKIPSTREWWSVSYSQSRPAKELIQLNRDYQKRAISAEQYQLAIEANPLWQKYADRPPVGEAELGDARIGLDGRRYIWVGAPPTYEGWVR